MIHFSTNKRWNRAFTVVIGRGCMQGSNAQSSRNPYARTANDYCPTVHFENLDGSGNLLDERILLVRGVLNSCILLGAFERTSPGLVDKT